MKTTSNPANAIPAADYNRRRFVGTAAMTFAAAQLGAFHSAAAQSSEAKPAEIPATKPVTGTSFAALKQIDAARFLHKLGVEEVIDYSKTQFYDALQDFDVVLDTVGGETLARSWSILKPGGVLVSIVSEPKPVNGNDNGVHGVFFVIKPNKSELDEIGRLLDAGHIRPVISSVFPLAEARKAFEKGLRGHNRGKLVLHVAD